MCAQPRPGFEVRFHNIDYANGCLGERSFPIARLRTMRIGVAKPFDNCYHLRGTGFFGIWTNDHRRDFGLAPLRSWPFGACGFRKLRPMSWRERASGKRARSMLDSIFGGDEQAHHEQR
jgi:hypothetical protein